MNPIKVFFITFFVIFVMMMVLGLAVLEHDTRNRLDALEADLNAVKEIGYTGDQ